MSDPWTPPENSGAGPIGVWLRRTLAQPRWLFEFAGGERSMLLRYGIYLEVALLVCGGFRQWEPSLWMLVEILVWGMLLFGAWQCRRWALVGYTLVHVVRMFLSVSVAFAGTGERGSPLFWVFVLLLAFLLWTPVGVPFVLHWKRTRW